MNADAVAVLPFSAETEASHERFSQLMDQLEQQKKAKAIPVSTNDEVVKARLRELGEPIILFGEQVLSSQTRHGVSRSLKSAAARAARTLTRDNGQKRWNG